MFRYYRISRSTLVSIGTDLVLTDRLSVVIVNDKAPCDIRKEEAVRTRLRKHEGLCSVDLVVVRC